MTVFIYKATNNETNKAYIGLTENLSVRQYHHYRNARLGSDLYFHRSIRKHGEEAFTWEIIAECNSREEADDYEIKMISVHKTFGKLGYNSTTGGTHGYKLDTITRRKQSESLMGRSWEDIYGIEGATKRRKEQSKLYKGVPKSAAQKRKISKTLKGKSFGPQKIIECPYCKQTGGNAMYRWHFDNCKEKE